MDYYVPLLTSSTKRFSSYLPWGETDFEYYYSVLILLSYFLLFPDRLASSLQTTYQTASSWPNTQSYTGIQAQSTPFLTAPNKVTRRFVIRVTQIQFHWQRDILQYCGTCTKIFYITLIFHNPQEWYYGIVLHDSLQPIHLTQWKCVKTSLKGFCRTRENFCGSCYVMILLHYHSR